MAVRLISCIGMAVKPREANRCKARLRQTGTRTKLHNEELVVKRSTLGVGRTKLRRSGQNFKGVLKSIKLICNQFGRDPVGVIVLDEELRCGVPGLRVKTKDIFVCVGAAAVQALNLCRP